MSEQNTTEAPQISITDLQNILRCVDVAAKRGAFHGSELSMVGASRDKIAAFVAAAMPAEPATEAEADAEPTEGQA